jgi:CCR4-NOT transcription complex subunit 1
MYQNGIEKFFKQYKYYNKYPKRELLLTAQLFGGLIERGLFPTEFLAMAIQILLEGLKKPMGHYLWNFAIAALDRCKSKLREHSTFNQELRNLPTYSELPPAIREYFDFNSKPTFEPPSIPQSHIYSRINSGPPIATTQQFGKETLAQKGVCISLKSSSLKHFSLHFFSHH